LADVEALTGPESSTVTRKKTSFAGDVLKLVSGTTVAQLLSILASPILTRLYAPEAFGVAALFGSITSILGVIACLRYELSIMLPETDEDAANLLGVSIGFAVLISLLTVPIVWWGKKPLLRVLNAELLDPYVWLMPVAVLLGGVFVALNYWNSRTRQFGRLSIARVISSLATTSTTLGAGFAGYATAGTMISAGVGGQAISTIVLGGQIWRDDGKLFLRSINWRGMLYGIKRHRRFPLYGIWSALLNTISWQLPIFLLANYFSVTVVGYYALGFRILQIPMSLIGTAIAQVFFQRAAEARSLGTLTSLVDSTFVKLVMVGVFPALTLSIIGHDLFSLVFGATWGEAGVYAQLLSLWSLFWLISSPLSTLLSVLEMQRFELQFNIILLAARFFALSIGGMLQNARLAILLFSAFGLILYVYLCVTLLSASGLHFRRIVSIVGQALLSFTPFGIILVAVGYLGTNIWYTLVVATISFLVYYVALYRLRPALFGL